MRTFAELSEKQRREFDLRVKVLAARRDPAEFVAFVGRTEGNEPMIMAEIHREWHRRLSAHRKCVIFAAVGLGKTRQLSCYRVLWELGHNPSLRIAIVSGTKEGMAAKILGWLKAELVDNPKIRLVFPNLRPSVKQAKWSDDAITVERPEVHPDPSVQIFGLESKAMLGSRFDIVLLDDACNQDNTATEHMRNKVWTWVQTTVFTRQPPGGGMKIWGIGNTWHEEDVLHQLGKQPDTAVSTTSAFKKDPETGEELTAIPEMYSLEDLHQRCQDVGTIAARRMYRCELVSDDERRIKDAWIDRCKARGRGLELVSGWNPADAPTITGCDLSITGGKKGGNQKLAKGDEAAIFTIAILPDGSRRILDLRGGRWDGPTILREIVAVHRAYGSLVFIEDNGGQDFLRQFAAELTAVPVRSHHTGSNKWDPRFGIESVGVELENGKWIIPCDVHLDTVPELTKWIADMRNYTPEDHVGDRFMASWIAREGARVSGFGDGFGGGRDDDWDWDTLVR